MQRGRRVGYVVSRFPSTTETFIAREMAAIAELGVDVSLYALVRQPDALVHPESAPFMADLHAAKLSSSEVLAAQLYWLTKRPAAYLRVWADALRGNLRSPKFLLRALAVVPAAAWFAREAKAEQLDHVHAHWATHSALAAWAMHRLTGLPYSITAHAHDIYVDRTMLDVKLREAKFVAVISEYNKTLLTDLYPEAASKLHVIRCGVDPDRFAPLGVEDHGGPLRVLCVASLQEYKGHAVLLRAAALLTADGFDLRLTMVGGGELAGSLAAQAEALGLADIVDWRGPLSSDEVVKLTHDTDVMVLPSIVTAQGKTEGIPVALMEALAGELAVVASDVTGIPELVRPGETGLLSPPGDAVALADSIRSLADPELRRNLGRSGRALVRAEFSAVPNAQRLVELLEAS